jgi:uncharacterized protein (DUF433 family)
MAEIDRNVLDRMLEQVSEFVLVVFDELKDVPGLPPSILETLPAVRRRLAQAFDLSRSMEEEAETPLIAAVQTISLEVLREAGLTDEDKQSLWQGLSQVVPRVLRAFGKRPEFRDALDEFLTGVLQPALGQVLVEHGHELATEILSPIRDGLDAWQWMDEQGTEEPPSRLEDYFDFLAEDDIRIKGTRIGVEHVLYHAIHRSLTPKQILQRYETLTLEQVYAALLFYEQHTEKLDAYLAGHLEFSRCARRDFWQTPPDVADKLRRTLKQKRPKGRTRQAAEA